MSSSQQYNVCQLIDAAGTQAVFGPVQVAGIQPSATNGQVLTTIGGTAQWVNANTVATNVGSGALRATNSTGPNVNTATLTNVSFPTVMFNKASGIVTPITVSATNDSFTVTTKGTYNVVFKTSLSSSAAAVTMGLYQNGALIQQDTSLNYTIYGALNATPNSLVLVAALDCAIGDNIQIKTQRASGSSATALTMLANQNNISILYGGQ